MRVVRRGDAEHLERSALIRRLFDEMPMDWVRIGRAAGMRPQEAARIARANFPDVIAPYDKEYREQRNYVLQQRRQRFTEARVQRDAVQDKRNKNVERIYNNGALVSTLPPLASLSS